MPTFIYIVSDRKLTTGARGSAVADIMATNIPSKELKKAWPKVPETFLLASTVEVVR